MDIKNVLDRYLKADVICDVCHCNGDLAGYSMTGGGLILDKGLMLCPECFDEKIAELTETGAIDFDNKEEVDKYIVAFDRKFGFAFQVHAIREGIVSSLYSFIGELGDE